MPSRKKVTTTNRASNHFNHIWADRYIFRPIGTYANETRVPPSWVALHV